MKRFLEYIEESIKDKIIHHNNDHFELGNYEAVRYKKVYGDNFSGWVVRHKTDKHTMSDPIGQKSHAIKTIKSFHKEDPPHKINETTSHKLGEYPTIGKRNASREEIEHTLNQYTPAQRQALRQKFGGRKLTALYHNPWSQETTAHFNDKVVHIVRVGKRGKITPIKMMSLNNDPGK